ncbi:MAG TPA: S16 family serine protease [Nitrospira sp.]|nr:S16 family serine protease [Nitrospira sp.]
MRVKRNAFLIIPAMTAWLLASSLPGQATVSHDPVPLHRVQAIPILGVTLSNKQPVGTLTVLELSFQQRADKTGLMLTFLSGGGRLSPKAETSVQQAIYRAAREAGLSTDSWTVTLSVPPGVTVYGDSLSAMVGLSVIACAKGEPIPMDRIVTGGIAPDGHISPVGGLAYKIAAADRAQIRRVIVPDEPAAGESDWQTPFLMQVSPVHSLAQAYFALTDHELR